MSSPLNKFEDDLSEESDNLTVDDRSELLSLNSELLNSVENLVALSVSAPSSPVKLFSREVSPVRPASALSSPRFGSVVHRTSSVKDLVVRFDSQTTSSMAASAKKEAAPLVRQISYAKGWITRSLKKLDRLATATEDAIDPVKLETHSEQVETQCDKIVEYQQAIGEIYVKFKAEDEFNTISDDLVNYVDSIQDKLKVYATKVFRPELDDSVSEDNITKAELLKAMSQIGSNNVKVKLDCPIFNGDESDRLAFKNWLDQFEAIVQPSWTEEFKIMYLKSKVLNNAAAFIKHIDASTGDYEHCITMLKEQYLNVPYIIDEYFKKLCHDKPEYDPSYYKTRTFIANTRNHLHNLCLHYEVDLLDETGNSHKLLSHIIFSKFSSELQQAFRWELKTEYPTFKQILTSYCKVTTQLENKKGADRSDKHLNQASNSKSQSDNFNSNKSSHFNRNRSRSKSYKSEPNFNTQVAPAFKRHCRFCVTDGHNSVDCPTFNSFQTRMDKCKELHLCTQCTSPSHQGGSDCPGNKTGQGSLYRACKYCGSTKHVAAVCKKLKSPLSTNVCLSTNVGKQSNFLLPILSITFKGRSGRTVSFNALVDTGSSRSYINPRVSKLLEISSSHVSEIEYDVKTFLGSGVKKLGETALTVYLPSGRYLNLPMFVDNSFKLDLEVRGLTQLVQNLNQLNYSLGAEFPTDTDRFPIDGLIGIDILQFVPFATMPCMNGLALRMGDKVLPFGNSAHFLYPGQVGSLARTNYIDNNFNSIMSNVNCSDHIVNLCLEPTSFHEDGLAPFFDSSQIERNIERMVNCDSLATESQEFSSYDLEKIQQFESSIEITDSIYVELVWKENFNEVPSNFDVALKVMERVYAKLERTGNLSKYNQVFFDQLSNDIIEEFECAPKDFQNYIWLPHRPVIKDEAQSTFKIRPVFNCSLKTRKDKPSLNETSYQGVNIMQNMLHVLLKFRTNSKVLLGDLEKAFLQIRLKLLRDKNRFCFFLKDGDRIRCFRYNTLLFGYVCSPFILNYVIKHIAGLYPDDECSSMMRSNFFVDNLAITSNSTEKLIHLYKECSARLSKVHFNLQSCNTNCDTLKDVMINDGKYIKHGCTLDKVLGYKYDAAVDSLTLSPVNLDANANTKRKIFSQSAQVFDPIGFTAPVLVRSKLLISTLWEETKNKSDHWDIPVSCESRDTWTQLAKDLNQLSALGFGRQAFSSEEPMDLFIFSDASQRAYGYVVYSVQRGDSNFVFAKVRSAPLKQKRSLPQLELLAAKLSLEGLFSLLSCFNNVNNIYLGVDAQIILAWLTSITTKNVYTSNRIKDTLKFIADLSQNYNLNVQLKYVPTAFNPADLLTRGLTFHQFQEHLEFWLKGPQFIRTGGDILWPSADLRCLSEASRTIVCASLDAPVSSPPLVSFQKFSKLPKLLNTVKFVIKFLVMRKVLVEETMRRLWGTVEPLEIAKLYLIAKMQEESFPTELEFLRGSFHSRVPDRVRDLNLFLDPTGFIRSQGRMDNVEVFSQELIHPILLGKNHHLTSLIIKHCHHKVQHLGVQPTLNRVRLDGFRLIHPFNAVRSVLKDCFICKRMNSLAFKYPKMTDLPAHRVNLIRPFAHTGVDYTGHLMVKEGEVDVKYYMLIFTCLNVRACHIELLPDMTATQFVYALIRFCNQYGIPDNIYSDNATTFKAGVIKLSKVFSSQIYQEHFGTANIRHLCIPLGAPWVGSCWERTIKTVKDCLKKAIGRHKLDYFKYVTVLSDIQFAVNCRPLTYRCSDNNDLEVITPINFLNPYGCNTLLVKNSSAVYPRNKSGRDLAESLDLRDQLMDNFREIWQNEYLLSLRDSYKDLRQENFCDKIKVGDIILVRNIKPVFVKRRQYWSLARVLGVIRGHDGKVRSASVLKGSADYLKHKREPEIHPISHLYPLELSLTHEYRTTLPDVSSLPVEIAPEVDFRQSEEVSNDTLVEPALEHSENVPIGTAVMEPNLISENVPIETDVIEPNFVPHASTSDLTLDNLPSVPAVRFSRCGRRIKPSSWHDDFIEFE